MATAQKDFCNNGNAGGTCPSISGYTSKISAINKGNFRVMTPK
jgi:hypothetical protein